MMHNSKLLKLAFNKTLQPTPKSGATEFSRYISEQVKMAKMKRSKGITFLGWLFLLNSLLGIITLFNLKKRIMSFEVAHFDLPESHARYLPDTPKAA